MRKSLGIVLLILGIAVLSWWGSGHQAARMQDQIGQDAAQLAETSIHGVTADTSGRDITLSGIVDSNAERDAVLESMDEIKGRRVVRDDLRVLETVAPYVTQISKDASGALAIEGYVPRDTYRTALDAQGMSGVDGLTLASGAAANWPAAMSTGQAALVPLDNGTARLEGDQLIVTGQASTPVERDALVETLAGLPDGITADFSQVTMIDDGSPAVFDVEYDATAGARITGKLPRGMAASDVGDALGLDAIEGHVLTARTGEAADPAIMTGIGTMSRWLPLSETARLQVNKDRFDGALELSPGADLEQVKRAANADLAAAMPGSSIAVSPAEITVEQGTERTNAATGTRERWDGQYWLPVYEFATGPDACVVEADKALALADITFVTGSATLDASAVLAINRLSAVVARCVANGDLRAEIGGHTDSQGNDALNLDISNQRASAVRDALVTRGVNADALSAVGYGETQPIATNDTAEGRAENRRTTITWFPLNQ